MRPQVGSSIENCYSDSMRLLLFFLFLTSNAWAKKLNLKNTYNGAYFKGGGTISNMGADAFKDSSGTSTTFADEIAYNYSAEVGFLFAGESLSFHAAYMFISQEKSENLSGTNAAGAELMTLTSRVFASALKGGFEVYFGGTDFYRFLVGVSAGLANANLENEYTVTAAGQALYSVAAAISEGAAKDMTIHGDVTAGFEVAFVDNTTFLIELGYRYFPLSDWEVDRAYTNFSGSSFVIGDTLVNDNGNSREVDLGGIFMNLGFRFFF